MNGDLQPASNANSLQPSVDQFSGQLIAFIGNLGLPTNGVLVGVPERRRVIANLADVVGIVPAERRTEAMYISKFVAACAGGLFDAALNYLWDETVVNLRAKVARFDLAYFYASAIESEDQRKNYKTDEDLVKLDDWELIRGCRQTGILSEIGFKHLDYIRDMRNWASAAHPNQSQLTGLQLISWLETCIREVLIKEPEGPGVEAQALLHNLRTQSLASGDIPAIASALQRLPTEIVRSIFRTVFGMFVDPRAEARVKDNLRLVASALWGVCSDDVRFDAGIRYATYSANGDVARKAAAKQFLDQVGGLSYLPSDSLAVELNEQLDNLAAAHYGWDNYRNEVPHARGLVRYISTSGRVPQAVLTKYVKTLLLCRIGNASYGDGVSRGAVAYYDQLMARMQERDIYEVAKLLADDDIASRLQFSACQANYRSLVTAFRAKVTNVHLASGLDMILNANAAQWRSLGGDSRYRTLIQSIVL